VTTIYPLAKLVPLIRKTQKSDQTVGLITGCFDIIHLGHIQLFQFAKKYVDILIIGLDNDQTIRLTKGPNRPIHKYTERVKFLSEIKSIDYIFKINPKSNYQRKIGRYYL